MQAVQRYWHTLRYLRPVQLYARLWLHLHRPLPDARPAPARRTASSPWRAPSLRATSMLGPARFRFLNQTHEVLTPAAWNDPTRDKLWLYNLHYFDDLNAVDAVARRDWHRALLARWVGENPPGQGTGWEPYPTSLRIVNWVKYFAQEGPALSDGQRLSGAMEAPGFGFGLAFAAAERSAAIGEALGGSRSLDLVDSLALQARWLRQRLEHHLLGNHLFADAKALVFAGAFFVGAEARSWLALGQRLLRRELAEQVLADGGHFERSPMYHAILLEDLLDLVQLSRVYPRALDAELTERCGGAAQAMLTWLAAMSHPDGEIGFFNDAAFGIAPSCALLARYAEMLGIAVPPAAARAGAIEAPVWLRDSGYVRLMAGPALALLDVAPIGPDYLPGHAHADTLSFELSLFGQRVIVNSGTSCYGSGSERLAERGTAAHSTLQLDAADSSEVWGGFRVARRARPFDVEVRGSHDGQARVSAAHDGYRRLPGRPVHRRRWQLRPGRLVVSDAVEGDFNEALARFHLHPAIGVEIAPAHQGARGRLQLPCGVSCRWRLSGGRAEVAASAWHPEFGVSLPTQCLSLALQGRQAVFELEW